MAETRERFRISVPLAKSFDKGKLKSKIPEDLLDWVIVGIASTEDRDIQGEILIQKGIDFRPLLASGYLNWNHSHNPEDQVGIPTYLEVVEGPALYIEAVLLSEVERAKRIRDFMRSMEAVREKGGPVRRMAFSVEGEKVLLNGDIVEKCLVDQMAITHEPVNPFTWADLVKSLTKGMMAGQPMAMGDQPAMATTTDSSLLNQNLDTGITNLIWGECKGRHFDPKTGRFYRGAEGALDHLVRCHGHEPKAAQSLLKMLYHSIYE